MRMKKNGKRGRRGLLLPGRAQSQLLTLVEARLLPLFEAEVNSGWGDTVILLIMSFSPIAELGFSCRKPPLRGESRREVLGKGIEEPPLPGPLLHTRVEEREKKRRAVHGLTLGRIWRKRLKP
jgi:hypothetical protein